MLKTLQACRAAAALLVVLLHTSVSIFAVPKYFSSRPFGRLFDFGYAGVDLFFVLSGFIIMHAHRADLGRPERLPRYLLRRVRRIYPTYWAVLALLLGGYFLVPSLGTGSQRDFGVIVRSFLLLPEPHGEPILGVAWSLVFEMFFYLLFALLLVRRWLGWTAFAGLAALACVRPWAEQYPFDFLGSEYHFRFLAGLLVAVVTSRWRIPRPRLVALCGLTMFLGTGLISTYPDAIATRLRSAGFTLGSTLLLAGLVEWEKTRVVAVPRLVLFLGDASYSIYLVHLLALSVLAKVTMAIRLDSLVPHTILFVGVVAGAIAAGAAFHLYVELPLRAIGRKKTAPKEQAPVEVAVWQAA
jgi:peptidoglycan/LPS O-acetylase OafA/YrhL